MKQLQHCQIHCSLSFSQCFSIIPNLCKEKLELLCLIVRFQISKGPAKNVKTTKQQLHQGPKAAHVASSSSLEDNHQKWNLEADSISEADDRRGLEDRISAKVSCHKHMGFKASTQQVVDLDQRPCTDRT